MKKLFTLLVLLVAIVTGAKAQTVIYQTEVKDTPASPATATSATGSFATTAVSWASDYPNYFLTSGSAGQYTLSFATPLDLSGYSDVKVKVFWGSTSNRPLNISINSGSNEKIDEISASSDRSKVREAEGTIAASTTSLSSIKFASSGGGAVYLFKVEITGTSAGPRDPSFTVPSEIVVGETGTIAGPSGLNFTATVKSGSEYVSVDGATITANAIGNAVITVSSEAVADTWNEFSQDYNVSVVDEPVTPQPVAGGEKTITFNGQNEGDTDYFTWNSDKHNFNSKFNNATYDGISFTSGLKMEGATAIGFTNTLPATVTIVQSTWSDKTIKFDGTELVVNDATAGTGCRVYTVSNVAAGTHSINRGSGESGLFLVKVVESAPATETFTVTFNAGSNGTCATTELTEESAGAGITLPSVTANEGYVFDGWFTAATGGDKIDDAGKTYHPTANVEIFAQYSQLAAPTSVTISGAPTAAVVLNQVVKLTATVEGAVPDATVDWLDESDNVLASATTTYTVPTTDLGEVKVKARATNESGSVSSELVTINVIDPNKYITGNAYYMSVDEVAVAGENVYADDITMTIKDYEGVAANADNYVSGINSNYVAQISGTHNGWGTEFVATKNGTLSVGVIINGDKTFTLTNVTSFDYNGVQDDGNNETSVSKGTNTSNTWKPSKKQWTVLTFDVVAGTTYKLSVAGSKMGFYGFEFVPTLTLTDAEGSTNATAIAAAKGKTVNATVTRALASDKYYGVFLPFALTAAQIQAAFGDGAEVAAFTGEVKNGKTFMFGKLDTDEGMEAYKGYLVKAGSSYAGNFTVKGVTIPEQVSAVGDATYAMVGTLDRYTYTEGSTIYYFTTAGTIKKLTSKGINGLRAFMADNSSAAAIITNIASNAGLQYGGGAGSEIQDRAREVFGIDLEDDVVTGIESIDNSQLTIDNDAPAYNLAGQKVGKGYKGIVIINGKKVVK